MVGPLVKVRWRMVVRGLFRMLREQSGRSGEIGVARRAIACIVRPAFVRLVCSARRAGQAACSRGSRRRLTRMLVPAAARPRVGSR